MEGRLNYICISISNRLYNTVAITRQVLTEQSYKLTFIDAV